MSGDNSIKLQWRLAALTGRAAAGIALAIGGCSLLISGDALAGASFSASSQQSGSQLPIQQSQAFQTFSLAQQKPQLLAIRDAKLKHPNHRLRIHNLCHKTVDVVVRYQDPQLNWLIQDGGIIPGKQSRYLTSSSSQILGLSNKLLFYYATSPDSDLVWSGNGSHPYSFGSKILNMRLHYSAIDILDDYSLFILCAEDSP